MLTENILYLQESNTIDGQIPLINLPTSRLQLKANHEIHFKKKPIKLVPFYLYIFFCINV